ncbi:MAG: efflux RND transporter periplasmic adaptor subunit [Hyphomicrobiaceae bacterium]
MSRRLAIVLMAMLPVGAPVLAATVDNRPLAVAAAPQTAAPASSPSGAARFKVTSGTIDDIKSVYATVRSTDRIEARARIGGTVAALSVDEGSEVETGKVMAIIADQKLALKLKALDAQIAGLNAQRANTDRELGRQEELIKRGFTPKAKVDELRTQLEVVVNQLKSATAERDVVRRQVEEGEVLAPANGRVLLVPITVGSVVMPGESLATIAANDYVLRLELPERHARFLRKGDAIRLGARGLNAGEQKLVKGEISQVYPELQSGRVIADAAVEGLGDFFVGERVLVYISGGKRAGIVIPPDYVTTRYGYDFVTIDRGGGRMSEVVVQLGLPAPLPDGSTGIEVLGGLNAGDELVKP